jgi:CPA1 family monovalent cation:H+ antiporter
LTLPWLIKKIKLEDKYSKLSDEEQERIIQKKIAKTSLQLLEEKYGNERANNQRLNNYMARLQIDVDLLQPNDDESKGTTDDSVKAFHNIYLEVLEQQRELLNKMNQVSEFNEDLIRKYLALIDIEEYKLRERQLTAVDDADEYNA